MGVQFLEMQDQIDGGIATPTTDIAEMCEAWEQWYPEDAVYLRDGDESGI
jgi:hypothetical protein